MCAHSKFESEYETKDLQNQSFEQSKNDEIQQDLLAKITSKQKHFFQNAAALFNDVQNHKLTKIVLNTTQPAHVISLIAVTIIGMIVSPMYQRSSELQPSPLMNMIYLTAFTTHFGSQMWMTFVSGLSLYFEIPRHTFGEVQKVLFPKYFSINSFLSLITLIMFVKLHPTSTWNLYLTLQAAAMIFCFFIELGIRLYLTPPLIFLISKKNEIEKKAGVGLEVGKYNPGGLSKCPHYCSLHKRFRKVHMTIAIGNLVTMSCTTIHLIYLANKLCSL